MVHDPYLLHFTSSFFSTWHGSYKGLVTLLHLSLAFSALISCCLLSARHVRKNQSYVGESYLLPEYVQFI